MSYNIYGDRAEGTAIKLSPDALQLKGWIQRAQEDIATLLADRSQKYNMLKDIDALRLAIAEAKGYPKVAMELTTLAKIQQQRARERDASGKYRLEATRHVAKEDKKADHLLIDADSTEAKEVQRGKYVPATGPPVSAAPPKPTTGPPVSAPSMRTYAPKPEPQYPGMRMRSLSPVPVLEPMPEPTPAPEPPKPISAADALKAARKRAPAPPGAVNPNKAGGRK